jgi:CHASE2 domain-containing sensor protein/two-component sensor histidine kinase
VKQSVWQLIQAQWRAWWLILIPGACVIAAIVGLRSLGALQALELMAYDAGLRLRPPEAIDDRVVIIGITEDDIRRAGTYPIPDAVFADLLQRLQTYQPAAIGLDIFRDLPVPPGHATLTKAFKTMPNVIVIERVVPDRNGLVVPPPPQIAPEQVGFADTMLDSDSKVRRALLGTHSLPGEYRFALALRLAELALNREGITLDNGRQDPEAMRFGQVELPRIVPNFGGYSREDTGGNQIMLNWRNHPRPFRYISLTKLQQDKVSPHLLQGRVVLIGIMAASVNDSLNPGAAAIDMMNGVELHAHVVSQIMSAVLDHRPLLHSWPLGWQSGWIVGWGLVGIGLARTRSLGWFTFGLVGASLLLMGSSIGLLWLGWWVPLVPAGLVLWLNQIGVGAFYRYEQDVQMRLKERQAVIEQTFHAIHNGPLQRLACLLQQANPTLPLTIELYQLNQELRAVYEAMRQEVIAPGARLQLTADQRIDLQAPLHQVLFEVYRQTLTREFPHFATIQIKVVKFEPLGECSLDRKRQLCRFLEETLCNVGKHATGATRLTVTCATEGQQQVIRVIDNGAGMATEPHIPPLKGLGTQQAEQLAQQLRGTFRRSTLPQGTSCELVWRQRRSWWQGIFGPLNSP